MENGLKAAGAKAAAKRKKALSGSSVSIRVVYRSHRCGKRTRFRRQAGRPPTLCRLYLPVGVPDADRAPQGARSRNRRLREIRATQLGDQGWQFSGEYGSDVDTLNGARYMHELYTPLGRLKPIPAVPRPGAVGQDRADHRQYNESADILPDHSIRILAPWLTQTIDLRPAGLEA